MSYWDFLTRLGWPRLSGGARRLRSGWNTARETLGGRPGRPPVDVADDQPGRPARALMILLMVLAVLVVYTGLRSLGWDAAAGWVLVGLVALGALMLSMRGRWTSLAAAVEGRWRGLCAGVGPDRTWVGFSDDPGELAVQLAQLRPGSVRLPQTPPVYARCCTLQGFDPLADAEQRLVDELQAVAQ
jgi:hypothetical protein